MKKSLLMLVVTSLVFLISIATYGYMGGGGPGGSRDLNVPQDYSSIQRAINAASYGDTVIVSEETYYEQITMKTGVNVIAEGTDEERYDFVTAGRTTIDGRDADGGCGGCGGGGGKRNNTVRGADTATLDGFTIIGAVGTPEQGPRVGGNGVLCVEKKTRRGTSPTIQNCIIEDNTRGIACAYGAKPTIQHNIIRNNEHVGIGTYDSSTAPTISENEIYSNDFTGIGCNGSSPIINGNYIGDNGGAGIGTENGATPTITGNAIGLDKYGEPHGNALAGIGCDGSSPTIQYNAIYYNSEAGVGVKNGASPVITDNDIGNNGMAGVGTDEVAPALRIEVHRNFIHDNTMVGIGCNDVEGLITNNIVVGNGTAGIAVYDTPLDGIYNNVVAYSGTVGITNQTDTAFPIENNICYGNSTPGIKSDVGGYDYNCLFGNNGVWVGGSWPPWVYFRQYGGNYPGPHDIFPIADPLFVDPSSYDFHLQAKPDYPVDSPCIDTGDPTIQDTDETRSDMGAYGGPNPFTLY